MQTKTRKTKKITVKINQQTIITKHKNRKRKNKIIVKAMGNITSTMDHIQ